MMLVRNYVGRSPIDGFGVFAGEFIPKGTMVWEFTEGCDQVYSDEILAALSPVQRDVILYYGYVEPGWRACSSAATTPAISISRATRIAVPAAR